VNYTDILDRHNLNPRVPVPHNDGLSAAHIISVRYIRIYLEIVFLVLTPNVLAGLLKRLGSL